MLRNRVGGLPSHEGAYSGGAGYAGGGSAGGGYQGGSYGGYSGGNGYAAGAVYGGIDPDNKYASKRRSSTSSFPSLPMNPTQMACIALGFWALIATGMNWSKSSQLKRIFKEAGRASTVEDVIDYLQNERRKAYTVRKEAKDSIRDHTERHSTKVKTLQEQINELQKHKEELIAKHESPEKKEQMENIAWREAAYVEQVELLQARVRKDSKRMIVERYGPGPHKVAFTYRIPDLNGTYGPEQTFVVQLAPLDFVPHAVHLFLEQVEHGLWHRDTYFYLNGPHVLQAGPQMFDEEDEPMYDDEHYEQHRIEHFYELDLEELIFPDYHESFPHVQWTLGFTGRPGGPDFYINKVDNQKSHGPGGQEHFVLYEQADSCFGVITEGRAQMEQLFSAKTYSDPSWEWLIEEPIPIVKAEIITKKPPRMPLHNKEEEFKQQELQQQQPQQTQQTDGSFQQNLQQQEVPPQQPQQQDIQQQQKQPLNFQQQQDFHQQSQQQQQGFQQQQQHHGHPHARLPPQHGRVDP
eukprot:scaffold328_cov130-Cylindrotheca_fusiformis.AAC.12